MEDGRKHQRCAIHWRSAVTVTGRGGAETLQCKTNDISVGGVSVVCQRNISIGETLTVYLLIDPGSPTHPQVIFESQGKVVNNVLSGQQGGFRLGIQFTKFARDSQELLKKHLPKEAVAPERLTPAHPAATPQPVAPVAAAAEVPGTAAENAPASAAETAPAEEPAPADDAAPAEGEAPSQT